MATIIWCDHVRHVVSESRTQVQEFLKLAYQEGGDPFIFFTVGDSPDPASTGQQRALNAYLISSYEALPGDGA